MTREASAHRDAPSIPPPIVKAAQASLDKASRAVESTNNAGVEKTEPAKASLGDAEAWMKYLTLGYGTAWGGKRSHNGEASQASPARESSPEVPMRHVEPEPEVDRVEERLRRQVRLENDGYFAIGLKGSLGDEGVDDDNEEGEWKDRKSVV